MAPRLDGWDRTLSEKGLRVVEVEYGPQTPRATLDAHLASNSTRYPILYDEDGSVTQRFAVRGFPSAFIVDRAGKVVWHGFPSNDVGAVQAALDRALAK